MARATKQLTAVKANALRRKGTHADGDGLYLQITATGSKSWPRKAQAIRHHPALPYRDLPAIIAELRSLSGITPRALAFSILTGARTGEVIGTRWSEIDANHRTWTIPATRMKSDRPHTMPSFSRSIDILLELKASQLSEFVFPGRSMLSIYPTWACLCCSGACGRE